MKPNRRQMLQLALVGGGIGVAGMRALADAPSFRRVGVAFDTSVGLTIVGHDERKAEAALDAGFAEIRRLERIAGLSTPGSDIRKLNATGRLENPDPALLDMLAVADDMHHATGGAFDVTVQPLWIFYDFFAKRGAWPTDEEAAPARKLIGQKFVRFDADAIVFERPGMGITLNSLTHGYAADRVAKILSQRRGKTGVRRYRRNGGIGPQRQGPRLDGCGQAPARSPTPCWEPRRLPADMATAGDYAYTWSEDYSRHHILDPRTGYSPASFACVSVIANRAVVADALSTAVSVVGPDRGREAAVAIRRRSLWRDQGRRGLGDAGLSETEFGVKLRF